MIVHVQNGQLPSGFCPIDYQSMLNAFSGQQFVDITSGATGGLIISSTPPAAADHDKAWLQLDSSGNPVRIYVFNGKWLSPHPFFPGFTMIWPFTLPEATNANLGFPSFDGGDANPISALSGPMWQLAKTTLDGSLTTGILQAQFPLGVGTLPVPPAGSGAAVTVGGVGGEERHKLIPSEEGNIEFQAVFDSSSSAAGIAKISQLTINGSSINQSGVGPKSVQLNDTAVNHNVLNPYYGVYFFQRTNRLYYAV
jgi:hypothetical protein